MMRRISFTLAILAALSGSAPAQQAAPRFGLSDLTQDDLLKIGRGIDAIVREEGAKGISHASAVYLKEALDLHLKLQAQITRQGAVLAEQAQKSATDKAVTEAVERARADGAEEMRQAMARTQADRIRAVNEAVEAALAKAKEGQPAAIDHHSMSAPNADVVPEGDKQ